MTAARSGSRGRICVFTGSRAGARPEYERAAREFGRILVERNYELVYGGGNVGLMAVIADTVLRQQGHVIGVIPEAFVEKEVAHRGLPDLRIVQSMHERKALMAELSDAFVGLPGGIGTVEEFFEVLSWAQIGIHAKPCGLLDVCGYYRPIVQFMDSAVTEGFLKPAHRSLLIVEENPQALLDRVETTLAAVSGRTFDRRTT
jgi:uncharacterized protein (TIGR00730 family)